MKITDRLKVEHGVFLEQLRLLERLLAEGAPPAVLRATVETIAAAEERHDELEDRLLYPELARAVGAEHRALQAVAADHERIRRLVASIRSGEGGTDEVAAFVVTLRDHLEREIHSVFPLAVQWIAEERLVALGDWDAEHLFTAVGERERWIGRAEKSGL
jgi:hemerythrin-like domain-containing protein